MLQEDLAKSITEAVGKGFDEQVEYTQKLIRYGGQRGEEKEVQEFVFKQYERRGYSPIKLEMDEEELSKHEGAGKFSPQHSKAPVVVGVHHPHETKGKSLILNAHIDVVPIGPEDLWTHPPYSGIIEGDWLYGRGGADMRAGHAANLYALDALRSLGLQPAAEVILESVVEEESTGNGTMLTHLKGYRADAVSSSFLRRRGLRFTLSVLLLLLWTCPFGGASFLDIICWPECVRCRYISSIVVRSDQCRLMLILL
jgi:acetylornithine deacetylase